MTSEDLYLCIACDELRRCTARQGYFRIPIRHEVLVDRGHQCAKEILRYRVS